VAAQGGVVLVVFLDEIGDLTPGKLLFEVEELLEIEATGDCEESTGGYAVGVEDLGG
jgi:hypothetical protein